MDIHKLTYETVLSKYGEKDITAEENETLRVRYGEFVNKVAEKRKISAWVKNNYNSPFPTKNPAVETLAGFFYDSVQEAYCFTNFSVRFTN